MFAWLPELVAGCCALHYYPIDTCVHLSLLDSFCACQFCFCCFSFPGKFSTIWNRRSKDDACFDCMTFFFSTSYLTLSINWVFIFHRKQMHPKCVMFWDSYLTSEGKRWLTFTVVVKHIIIEEKIWWWITCKFIYIFVYKLQTAFIVAFAIAQFLWGFKTT